MFALHHPLPLLSECPSVLFLCSFSSTSPSGFPRADGLHPHPYLSPETHRSRHLLDSVSSPFNRFLSWENSRGLCRFRTGACPQGLFF